MAARTADSDGGPTSGSSLAVPRIVRRPQRGGETGKQLHDVQPPPKLLDGHHAAASPPRGRFGCEAERVAARQIQVAWQLDAEEWSAVSVAAVAHDDRNVPHILDPPVGDHHILIGGLVNEGEKPIEARATPDEGDRLAGNFTRRSRVLPADEAPRVDHVCI